MGGLEAMEIERQKGCELGRFWRPNLGAVRRVKCARQTRRMFLKLARPALKAVMRGEPIFNRDLQDRQSTFGFSRHRVAQKNLSRKRRMNPSKTQSGIAAHTAITKRSVPNHAKFWDNQAFRSAGFSLWELAFARPKPTSQNAPKESVPKFRIDMHP